MRAFAGLTCALLLAGCAKDNEDRAFFNTGWLKPEDAANRRMYGPRTPGGQPSSEAPSRAEGR